MFPHSNESSDFKEDFLREDNYPLLVSLLQKNCTNSNELKVNFYQKSENYVTYPLQFLSSRRFGLSNPMQVNFLVVLFGLRIQYLAPFLLCYFHNE